MLSFPLQTRPNTLRIGSNLLDLTTPKVMGVLNLTDDSFFDGGRFKGSEAAKSQIAKLVEDGADLLDLGAYSSRPGAKDVPVEVEIERLVPIVRWINLQCPSIGISIDTFRASVARVCVDNGAHIINDISGGTLDPDLFNTVADLKVPYILMHMRGTPQTMQQQTEYANLILEMSRYFVKRIAELRSLGVTDIILDPGFGFAKTTQQNFSLLDQLTAFEFLGLPLLGGISRKSMIYKTLGLRPAEALNGTTVLNTILLLKGVQLLRVHDVREAVQCIKLVNAMQTAG